MQETAASNAKILEGQQQALDLVVRGAPLPEILETIVRTIEAQSESEVLGSILLLDETGKQLVTGAAPSLPPAYNAAIDGITIGPRVGSCGTAAATGKTVIVTNIATDPLWRDFRSLARIHDLHACWSTPIKSSGGQVLGTFAVYHRQPAAPTPHDLEVVSLLNQTAADVIERDRARTNLGELALRKLTAVLGEARAKQLLAQSFAELGFAAIETPAQLKQVADSLAPRGGFIAAVGAMLGVAAVVRGA